MTWLAKLKGLWATCSLTLIIGFCIGWLALKYVGIPFLVPSHETLSIRVAGYEGLEKQASATIIESEELRADEGTTAVEAIDAERQQCQARITNLTQTYERALQLVAGDSHETDSTDDDRRWISARELFGIPEELEPSGDQ